MNYYEKREQTDIHPLLKKFEKLYDVEKDNNKRLRPYISIYANKKYTKPCIRLGDKGQTYALIYRYNDIYAIEHLEKILYFTNQKLLLEWYKKLF